MGGQSYSSDAYNHIKQSYQGKTQKQVFQNTAVIVDMSPKGVTFRESRDSDTHPESLPIIVALDVTGSMGSIPENLIKNKLNILMETLIKHGVEHASICFCAIGDHYTDQGPLQIGQFESGTDELIKWLSGIWLEGRGGGQDMESYSLAWLFASRHTSTDSFEKRGIKGFLFTIGDEYVHNRIEDSFLKNYMGYSEAVTLKSVDLLEDARKQYHVFHIHCNHGSYNRDISDKWRDLMDEGCLITDDPDTIPEIIASTVAIMMGSDRDEVTKDFSPSVALTVSNVKIQTVGQNTDGVLVL